MNAFDKIIGYESNKRELIQICDMIHNKDICHALGAKLPKILQTNVRLNICAINSMGIYSINGACHRTYDNKSSSKPV
jgi:hypothetical protein